MCLDQRPVLRSQLGNVLTATDPALLISSAANSARILTGSDLRGARIWLTCVNG
jgi:hypothetical protein